MEYVAEQKAMLETPLKFEKGINSVEICYHPEFGSHSDLVLLELPDSLLPDLLNQSICLRGESNEDAVLCTPSKTFGVKTVSTSNSVYLIPPSLNPAVAPVIEVAASSMELHQVAPRLDKLRKLLSQRPYTPNEEPTTHQLLRWEDLTQLIQASDDELKAGLQALSAVEINGYWRLVDLDYMDYMLSMLINNAVLNDWSFNALGQDHVVSSLTSDGVLPGLAFHCLSVFAQKIYESDLLWKIDERSVCVHYAHQILRRGKQKVEIFKEEWARKLPDGMHANFEMLEGEVLIEKIGAEKWVRSFSASALPSDPADRFSILFNELSKWEWKDLQPYVRDLSVPGLSAEGLLVKYTRKSQAFPDAEPIYTLR